MGHHAAQLCAVGQAAPDRDQRRVVRRKAAAMSVAVDFDQNRDRHARGAEGGCK